LLVVSGFLGSGKTTLILAAARILAARGIRCAVILNDQGESLVDTELARARGFAAGEVTGGCFCCRFSELMRIADRLRADAPQVIFAEPVGSCTDLCATVLRPIEEAYGTAFQLGPLTVLVDPERAGQLDHPDIEFLFRKQLEEADLVCFTKSDRWPQPPQPGGIAARQVSALTGQGVEAWLDEVLSGSVPLRGTIPDLDYERYAQAEAALAWLNAGAAVVTEPAVSPAMLVGPLLDRLDRELTEAGILIVHLKAIDRTATGFVKAAQCANGQEPAVEGALDASPAREHRLSINLRAVGEPGLVLSVVRSALGDLPGRADTLRIDCFRPAAPKPERRVTGGSR